MKSSTDTLKLIIATDFHSSQQALKNFDALLSVRPYDCVIMAGDLINTRAQELPYAESFIHLVKEHRLPLFGLHGNNDPIEAYELYRKSEINIHLESRKFYDYTICGIGGFGYLNEPGFEDLSVDNLVINDRTVFVTHVPPRPSELEPVGGPLIHIFGHRHSQSYTKYVGSTLQIQCPAGNLGKVTELILPEKQVNFISL